MRVFERGESHPASGAIGPDDEARIFWSEMRSTKIKVTKSKKHSMDHKIDLTARKWQVRGGGWRNRRSEARAPLLKSKNQAKGQEAGQNHAQKFASNRTTKKRYSVSRNN